jgi:hypothetical protein
MNDDWDSISDAEDDDWDSISSVEQADQSKAKRMAALPKSLANIEADQASYSPTAGMAGLEKFGAGMGKAFVDLARGAGQMVGKVSTQDVADSRRLDAPLMETGAGNIGNFAGNVAALAPAAFVPGVNTVAGAGAVGALSGLLQPAETTQEMLTNTALGGVLGGAGQKFGQWAGPKIGQAMNKRATAAAERKAENAVRDDALAEARKLGYKAPPATVNQDSTVARAVESVAGKEAMKQTSAVGNQRVTNRLVREEFGLPKSAPLRTSTLKTIREKEGKVYQAVKDTGEIATDDDYLTELADLTRSADELANDFPDLNFAGSAEVQALQKGLTREKFSANGAMEAVKKLRNDASKNLAWNVEDPSKKALGLAQREAAGIVEDQVIRHLKAIGKPELASQFDKARQTIAKTYSVQAALNEGTGNVVASKLAAQLRKGRPLSGNLEKIARFASSVESGVVKEPVGSPGVSALIASLSTAGGAGGLAMGNPALAAAAAGVPLTREAVRRMLLTKAGQSMAAPSYAPRNALLGVMQDVAPLSAPVAIGFGNTK